MPTASIDTFFACSLLVILVVSAMAAMPTALSPFLSGLDRDDEIISQLAQHILLKTGAPPNWGSTPEEPPTMFGLASDSLQPYCLDADKVTRLNSEHEQALSYAQLLDLLKVEKLALQIMVHMLFEVSIDMVSEVDNGDNTTYSFEITAHNAGFPVKVELSCYIVLSDYLDNAFYSSNSNGEASVTFTIPNSLNGSTLLLAFARAKADPKIVSYGVYAFGHSAEAPGEAGAFMRLSPLGSVLNVSLNYPSIQVLDAYAFSFAYSANLTLMANESQRLGYSFTRFADKSVTLLALTGLNDSTSFVEWAAYPQVPVVVGVDFAASTSEASVASSLYIVAIGGAVYAVQIAGRKVG